jgi:hypothetical protein
MRVWKPADIQYVPQSKKSFTVHGVSDKKRLSILFASRYGGSVMGFKTSVAIFVSDLQDGNKKFIFYTFFAYYFLMVHLHHFKIRLKVKRSHKTVGINVFLTISA